MRIAREEGLAGFYTGLVPTCSRNIPFVVTTFTTFSFLKARLRERSGEDELSTASNLLAGVTSALLGALLTQPVDVVKTRMMTQAASSAVPYSGLADCVKCMWDQEGPGVFFKGLKARMAYIVSPSATPR